MSAYLQQVLADSPLHYWRFAESAGGLAHDIGSSRFQLHGLGTAIAPVFGYSGPNSDGGCADLCLDGQYVNTGNPVTLSVNPFSLELLYWGWQRQATTVQLAQIQSANQIALFHDATTWRYVYNGVTISTNHNFTWQAWHHFVINYDGANMNLYVDGFRVGPTAAGAQASLSTLLEISTNSALSAFSGGYFSELAYYTTALSALRVSNHFGAIDQLSNTPVAQSSSGDSGSGGSGLSIILAEIRAAVYRTMETH